MKPALILLSASLAAASAADSSFAKLVSWAKAAGRTAQLNPVMAVLSGQKKGVEIRSLRVEDDGGANHMYHAIDVVMDGTDTVVLSSHYNWPRHHETYVFRASAAGELQSVLLYFGQNRLDGTPVGEDDAERKDLASDDVRERFQYELSYWQARRRKARR